MTKKTKTRIKSAAADTPQDRSEVQNWIKKLGDAQRKLGKTTAAMNDEIANITETYKSDINALSTEAKALQKGIQSWCEANRDELTDSKTKTANLVTGEVSWRQRPPSVTIRGKEAVIESCRSLGLTQFIRTKEEINKDAMLNEADKAASVAGVTIKTGVEDFVIKPFEQEVE